MISCKGKVRRCKIKWRDVGGCGEVVDYNRIRTHLLSLEGGQGYYCMFSSVSSTVSFFLLPRTIITPETSRTPPAM